MRLLLNLGVLASLACAPRAERVILVSIDTLRADHVGAYGASKAHTPTLDSLAAAGVRFENAISPAPLTLPSHTTLMTGLDPPEHGVRHNGVFALSDAVPTLASALRTEGFQTGAFLGAFVLARRYGLDRGFDEYDDQTVKSRSGRGVRGYAERPANAVVDAALRWLEHSGGHFFLWLHLYDPHADYQPPDGFAMAFPGDPYAAEIAFADAQVGRLLARVAQRWGSRDTLVVIVSDHGESLGEHGERTHSHFVYDATQRVPLILRGPGLPSGVRVPGVVALKDVAPTLLDLLGVDPLPGASGRSLVPQLNGAASPDRVAYIETLSPQLDWGWSPLLGLRTDRYKLIRAPRPELYALDSDPGETRNRIGQEPEVARRLNARLDDFLKRAAGLPDALSRSPDAAERARLESLGYVVRTAGGGPSPSLGRIGGTDPKDGVETVAAVGQADQYLADGHPERALVLLASLGEKPGLMVDLLMATAALALGDAALAERRARAGIAAAPRYPVGHARLATALEQLGRRDEARRAWEEVARLTEGSGAALSALGRMAEDAGELARALDFYRRALAAPDSDRPARWRLAALLLERGQSSEADALLAGAGAEDLVSPRAIARLATAERSAGRSRRAEQRLAAGAAAHPGSVRLRALYAELLETQGRPAAARAQRRAAFEVLKRSIEDAPGRKRGYYLLLQAELLADGGRAAQARLALEQALSEPAALWPQARRRADRLAARLGRR